MKSTANILIAEDHTLVAKLLKEMLAKEEDVHVAGVVHDGNEVLDFVEENPVDVVLLDIDMPNLNGFEAMNILSKKHSEIKVIILSSHTESWVIQKALKAGASAYLSKFAESSELVEAVKMVLKGENYFDKTSFRKLMKKLTNKEEKAESNDAFRAITTRELEVLKLIAKELTTKEISDVLCISARTVETHRKNILRKLSVKGAVGLVKAAIEAGLIDKEFEKKV